MYEAPRIDERTPLSAHAANGFISVKIADN
jgi:hypothetical protein